MLNDAWGEPFAWAADLSAIGFEATSWQFSTLHRRSLAPDRIITTPSGNNRARIDYRKMSKIGSRNNDPYGMCEGFEETKNREWVAHFSELRVCTIFPRWEMAAYLRSIIFTIFSWICFVFSLIFDGFQ